MTTETDNTREISILAFFLLIAFNLSHLSLFGTTAIVITSPEPVTGFSTFSDYFANNSQDFLVKTLFAVLVFVITAIFLSKFPSHDRHYLQYFFSFNFVIESIGFGIFIGKLDFEITLIMSLLWIIGGLGMLIMTFRKREHSLKRLNILEFLILMTVSFVYYLITLVAIFE